MRIKQDILEPVFDAIDDPRALLWDLLKQAQDLGDVSEISEAAWEYIPQDELAVATAVAAARLSTDVEAVAKTVFMYCDGNASLNHALRLAGLRA